MNNSRTYEQTSTVMILVKLIVLPPLSGSTNGEHVNEVIRMCDDTNFSRFQLYWSFLQQIFAGAYIKFHASNTTLSEYVATHVLCPSGIRRGEQAPAWLYRPHVWNIFGVIFCFSAQGVSSIHPSRLLGTRMTNIVFQFSSH